MMNAIGHPVQGKHDAAEPLRLTRDASVDGTLIFGRDSVLPPSAVAQTLWR
jgi:hypothetical protein